MIGQTELLEAEYKPVYDFFNKCSEDLFSFIEIFHPEKAFGVNVELSPKQNELFEEINKGEKHVICLWSRQTGKSTVFSMLIVWWLLFGKNEHVVVLAPTENQVKDIYDKVARILLHFDFFKVYLKKISSEEIIAWNGCKVSFLSASPGSHIRGKTATKIVLDETQHITDNKYYGDILPFLATIQNYVILEAGTPQHKNHFFTVLSKEGTKVIRQIWTDCPFINRDYVLDRKAKSPQALFEQEFLCKFIEEGYCCFPEKWFFAERRAEIGLVPVNILEKYKVCHDAKDFLNKKKKIKTLIKNGAVFTMGYDQGRQVDNAALCVWRVDYFPVRLVYLKLFPLETTNPQIIHEMKILYELFEPTEINIDWTGEKGFKDFLDEAGLPAPLIKGSKGGKGKRKIEAYHHGLIVFNTVTKTKMMTRAQALIEKGLIRLPMKEEVLFQQFVQQQYEIRANKFLYYHPSNAHDDALWACLLALKNVHFEIEDIKEADFANIWKEYNKALGYDRGYENVAVSNKVFERMKTKKGIKRWKKREAF